MCLRNVQRAGRHLKGNRMRCAPFFYKNIAGEVWRQERAYHARRPVIAASQRLAAMGCTLCKQPGALLPWATSVVVPALHNREGFDKMM